MPKEERGAIEESDEILCFLGQSHISERNLSRLRTLAASSNRQVADLASVALEVALAKPCKKRRLKFLAETRPDLLKQLEETGLIFAHHS